MHPFPLHWKLEIPKVIKRAITRSEGILRMELLGQTKSVNAKIFINGKTNDINVPLHKTIYGVINGNENKINIDESIIVEHGCMLNVKIDGNRHKLIIGKNVKIRRGLSVKLCLAGPSYGGCHNCTVEIGENTIFNGKEIQLYAGESNTKITIGKDTLWADNITVSTSDYHAIIDTATGERINPAADILIGDHTWIGMNTIIFKGSVIPKGAVVAANAVVTRPFDEENIIIAGVPARIVKRGVTWRCRLD